MRSALDNMRSALVTLIVGAVLLLIPSQAQAVSSYTTQFVASFEGFSSCVYADPAGHATIGYGRLLHYGPPTRKDRKKWGCISETRALKMLKKDLADYEAELLSRIRGARVTPSMMTALTSFAYNLGPGALDYLKAKGKGSDTNIARQVRKGHYRRAGKQMLLFDGIIVNGKRYELEGLRIRRRKEFRLMVKDIVTLKQCGNKCPGRVVSGGLAPRTSGGLKIR
jgi:GH24 family phage-related lysozyme (muramidase)